MNKKEIAAYVRNNVDSYEERLQSALNKMDHMREPLRVADWELYDEIVSAIEEWCDDEEVDFYELDLDEVIDEIIWSD